MEKEKLIETIRKCEEEIAYAERDLFYAKDRHEIKRLNAIILNKRSVMHSAKRELSSENIK